MAARLTDKQIQKIIADFVELGSYNAAAKANGVSDKTVKKYVVGNPDVPKTYEQKKAENTASVLAYMEGKRDVVNEIIGKGLNVLNDEEKLKEASPAQITTALGTLIDKFTAVDTASAADNGPYELPARVLGKAFVDINRRIVPNKTYVFKGGRGGLKSSYISLKIVELIKNNPQMHACIVRKVYATIKDSVYAQMLWAITELGLEAEFKCKTSPYEIVYKATGQTIYFRGCDDPLKLKGIKPTFGYVGILWKEEKDQLAGPNEERSVNQSVLRGGPESYDFSSYNPPRSRANWVNKAELEPDDNRVIHESCYTDAPPEWLGQKFLDDAARLKELNPAAYANEYEGVANGDGGSVFENLVLHEITDDEIYGPVNPATGKREGGFDRIYNGLDWGYFPDPWAFNRMHYDAARMALYIFAEATRYKMRNKDTAQVLRDMGITDDDLITADSAEQKSVKDYQEYGLLCKGAVKGPGSVDYSHKWLQSLVKIVIDPRRCPDTAKEFTEYEYERDKDGNIISGYPDANNHHIDAVRYAMETVWKRRGQ